MMQMNGASALVGMSVRSVSERYCGWSSVRDRKHNVDSLNWTLKQDCILKYGLASFIMHTLTGFRVKVASAFANSKIV